MKSFEQQTADAIRALTIACVILGVALVVAILVASLGLAKASNDSATLKKSVQSPTHSKDIALWCGGIDGIINYERGYTTGSVKQSQSEAQTIEKAIANPNAHGLTASQAAFIRLYLDSVVALEREAPQTLKLHPFTLGDLNCAAIEAGEAASSHAKR